MQTAYAEGVSVLKERSISHVLRSTYRIKCIHVQTPSKSISLVNLLLTTASVKFDVRYGPLNMLHWRNIKPWIRLALQYRFRKRQTAYHHRLDFSGVCLQTLLFSTYRWLLLADLDLLSLLLHLIHLSLLYFLSINNFIEP